MCDYSFALRSHLLDCAHQGKIKVLTAPLTLFLQVCDLKENRKYQFQVRAANIAGVGIPSLPSEIFLCEEWTIAVPGGDTQLIKPVDDVFSLQTCFRVVSLTCCLLSTTGPPHDLQVREVRSDSMTLLWKPPVYQGRDPVNGYYIDIKEADAEEEAWRGINTKATERLYIKVAVMWLR